MSKSSTKYIRGPFIHCFIILYFLVFFTACDTGEYIKGNGNSVTDQRVIPSFNAIDIQGNYEVKLIKNEKSSLKIIADDNIIPHILSVVENDTLKINNKNKIKSNNNIKIYINYWDLKAINCGGASSIKCDTPVITDDLALNLNGTGLIELELDAKTLELFLSGTGLINLSGYVDKEILILSGAGKVNASDLKSRECNIDLSGIGSAQIYVEDRLNAHLSGVGGIKYKGNPNNVNTEVVGIGTINKENN